MKKLIDLILAPWRKWKQHREYKRRLKEIQERDPFIYK